MLREQNIGNTLDLSSQTSAAAHCHTSREIKYKYSPCPWVEEKDQIQSIEYLQMSAWIESKKLIEISMQLYGCP